MAQTIQIKRNNSNAATKPSSLLVGELAGNLLDRSLYSYDGSNVFQFYTGTDKWFDILGNANNALKLGGVAASDYLSKTDASKTYQTILGLNNKLSASYISGLASVATSGKYSDLSGTPSSLPASDVYAWAKAATKPSYTASEVGALSTEGGTLTGGLTITSGNLLVRKTAGDIIVNQLYPTADNAYLLGHSGRRWSDLYTVLINGGTPINSNNYSSYALPLSGGILSDSWSGGTEIRRKDSTNGYASLIFSQADGTILGRFGFGGVDNPLFITQAGGYNTLIHSGNIGSQSVDKATKIVNSDGVVMAQGDVYGLAISGSSSKAKYLLLSRASKNDGGIIFQEAGDNKWQIVDSGGALTFYNYTTRKSEVYMAASGNILLGTKSDSAAKLRIQTGRTDTFTWSLGNLASKSDMALEFYQDNSNIYGLYTAINYSTGDVAMQVGRSDGGTSAYNLILNPLGGNVLIGTKTNISWADLNVNGPIATKEYISFYRSGEQGYVGCATNANNDIYLSASTGNLRIASKGFTTIGGGNVLIGTTTDSGYRLAVEGHTYIGGNLTATGDGVFGSDARYKSKIQDLAVDIETIANAPVFSYKWTDREDDKVHLGTTAQYWMDTNFKDAVDVSNKDFYHLNYGALGVAIGVSLAKKTFDHEERIKALEKENKELKNEIKQLKQWLN